MNKKLLYLALGAVVLVSVYVGVLNYLHNPNRVIARFNQQLRKEKFEELYKESDNLVKKNVTQEEFVHRMKDVVGKLKEIDPDLNLQKDLFTEEITAPAVYLGRLKAVPQLTNDKYGVNIMIYWNVKGLFPKFYDLTVLSKNEESARFAVQGISYKNISREMRGKKETIIYHY